MQYNARIYCNIYVSIIFSSLHLIWLMRTGDKWTSPGYFFISYSILLVIAFLLVEKININFGVLGCIFIGVFFCLLVNIAACIISNTVFTPCRFYYFLNSSSIFFEFIKLVPFMSTVTGGWIAKGIQ
jgi:hypothetical protein